MKATLTIHQVLVAVGMVAALAVGTAGGGCAVQNEDAADGEDTASGDDAISGDDAVSRAMQWVDAKLHYCQAPNGDRDYDSACSTYCKREHNSGWDPYRSDCSGLVSWAWKLPAPGRTTYELAPFEDAVTHTIQAINLEPGDAVNNDDHVMLFKHWVSGKKGKRAVFIEEPGCSASEPYAREWSSDVSLSGGSIYVAYNGMTFHAIRYNNVTHAAPPPAATESAPKNASQCGRLLAGEGLTKGESVKSCDGRFTLVLQTDNNLVLYQKGKQHALWATGTNADSPFDLRMQSDGNLVMYEKDQKPIWNTGTYGEAGAHFAVQDDGNLVIYNAAGKATWASNTCCH